MRDIDMVTAYCPRCDTLCQFRLDTCPTHPPSGVAKKPVEVLHRLWSAAVGQPGYDKEDWKALQKVIEG